jgi:hypothetical protein
MIKTGGSILTLAEFEAYLTLTLAELDALKQISSHKFTVDTRINEAAAPFHLPGVDSEAFIDKLIQLDILTCIGNGTKGRILQFSRQTYNRFFQPAEQPTFTATLLQAQQAAG